MPTTHTRLFSSSPAAPFRRWSIGTHLAWGLTLFALDLQAADSQPAAAEPLKQIIGPTAIVEEAESDLTFPARVDTGATTSSLHVEDCEVLDESEKMRDNVGKKIRFRIKNEQGESEWLEREIAEISVIKTSEREERRYKVPVTLNCLDVKKRVLVSLNDRSHMTYPLLLGRNFLEDDFVVDVSLSNQGPQEKPAPPSKPQSPQQAESKPPTAPRKAPARVKNKRTKS